MEFDENIKNNIQRLRKERNVTQEVLAAALEISVQAVSKWETGSSLPDILQLPRIARFFGVTIDYLFHSTGNEAALLHNELPQDDVLRIMQFRGNQMLGSDLWEKDKAITLKLPEFKHSDETKIDLSVEIWGNANIEGDIGGYVQSNGGVNCGNIGSYVECDGGVNCGNVGSYIDCDGGVNCGNISGYLECDGGVNCGNIGQYLECDGAVNCGNIGGNVECDGDVNCGDITGSVECGGDLSCNNILSDVECEGDIQCSTIQGNVTCEGDIIYK
ncbi:MAG: methyltransferase protein [Herbinix sp.]|jgi:transcriptional regulator with XRE-family HTH domain|nr:methyltransferase protein [Herbinix sp.]